MPRVKGQNKSIDKARKYLRSLDDVKDLLSDHFIEAYNVIYAVMTDEKAPAASRRAAARDIITMYFDQYEDSKKKVDGWLSQLEQGSDEDKEDQKKARQLKELEEQAKHEPKEEKKADVNVLTFKSYNSH